MRLLHVQVLCFYSNGDMPLYCTPFILIFMYRDFKMMMTSGVTEDLIGPKWTILAVLI